MNEGLEIKHLTIDEAVQQIMFVEQRVSAFGANDSELPELERLRREVQAGTMTPEEGLRQAEIIERSKNDRH